MEDATKNALLRTIPSIDELLSRPSLTPILASHTRATGLAALRRAQASVRARLLGGEARPFSDEDVVSALKGLTTPALRRVHNATGVVLHTNLGRAPLAERAAERVREIAASYSNLEFDLDEGARGSRYAPVVEGLCALTGAEDAVVVNNNAAAVLLVLSAMAQGREAVVSRGELVEIGGGFRVPDVMRQSGVRLVEVGTTNRTRIGDYEAALGEATGLLVKVHRSNFAVVGFTEEATTRELAELGRRRGVPFFEDLGSGCLAALEGEGLSSEPLVKAVVAAGADVVSFSGDKLLGGPQAGIIVGASKWIERIRKHPLNRALRVDKLTVAALEATLELYREERREEIPVFRMLAQSETTLRGKAEALRRALEGRGVRARVVESAAQVGGGAMPLSTPRSFACALASGAPLELQAQLRSANPPVIGRVTDGELWLDVYCLSDAELEQVATAVGSLTSDKPC